MTNFPFAPEELRECWNQNRGEMLEWTSLDVLGRRKAAEARLAEIPDLGRWARAIQRAAQSDFCTGRIIEGDREPFIAGPDWILKPGTLVLIEEGQFDSRRVTPPEDAERSPADLSHFDLEKDQRLLTADEIRRLRICGLAVRAWERERREWYGRKRSSRGETVGEDPRRELVRWAFGETQHVPGLVVNYGPPLDTGIRELERLMAQHGCSWQDSRQ